MMFYKLTEYVYNYKRVWFSNKKYNVIKNRQKLRNEKK